MHLSARAHPLRIASLLVLLATLLLAVLAPNAMAVEPDDPLVTDAVDWLDSRQIDDGSFSAFGDEGDPGTTADVVFALVAAGIDPTEVESASGSSAVDYLTQSANQVTSDPGLAGKVALALIAAGVDPRDTSGTDLIAAIQAGINSESGFYGMGAFSHAYALLALAAADEAPPSGAFDALLEAQIEDGSWGFTGEAIPGTGDSNTTALAIQALAAHATGDEAVQQGLDYLRSLQDENGAVAYDASAAPNLAGDANSTALAIQAFVAAGEDASDLLTALEGFHNPSGAFFWREDTPDDSLLATAQAIPALLEMPLPLGASSDASGGPQQAGLVVRLGDGTLHYATVEFDEPSIDGLELLSRSGLDVAVAPFGGMGGAVCSIEDEGCPSDDCFCHSYSNPSFFWHYYTLEEEGWVEHPLGAASRDVSAGDIDGWSWTSDDAQLPVITLDEIAASSTTSTADSTDESRGSTYLVFGGMVALVLVIGGFGVLRSRRNGT